MAVDDSPGEVDQLAVGGARVGSQHLKGDSLVDRVTLHQYPLGPLDHGPAPERALEVVVLGEAAQDDVDRALPVLRVGVRDIGENPALGRLPHEFGIGGMDQHDYRAGGLLHDLLDQLERMLGALAQPYERSSRPAPWASSREAWFAQGA